MGGSGVNEDEIIRRKLLIDGEGMGDDRRLELLMRSFVKWAAQEEGEEDQCSTSLTALENAVDGCLKSMIKSHKVLAMNEAELAQYNELYAQIGDEIRRTGEEIAIGKKQLATARQIRANKEHYNAMAAVIAKEKDRTETTRELERAERGMVELQSRREALARRIEQHHRQFQVLLTAVQQLQQLNNSGGNDELAKSDDILQADDDADDDVALLEEGEMEEGLDTPSHASHTVGIGLDGRGVEMSGEDTQDTLEGSVVTMHTD
ncbi:THO complex subunit 7 homolog isoform X2 [Varroa jacobsoni]|uniref:THO complex subunit 7 n=1 Tax=Varroa destructor TaxID=109461 RepID=A0A7M7KRN8_VARDE|nr:THO complex subunit 7 homolog isoform X2 [Varroa destructor]XP_022704474.1 THO complex subunit 7 homolog isoform X2 [Varroa jacobsoni]